MGRKYKFFIKDESLTIIESSAQKDHLSQGEIEELIELMRSQKLQDSLEIKSSNLEAVIASVFGSIKVIKAGGGYVLNPVNELLMIFRRGAWDLPKGKLDLGETIEECALREVREECGVSGLEIISQPFSTFHLYTERNGETVIKESVWFKMRSTHQEELIPQTEEDIELAIWQPLPVPEDKMSKAYSSIQDVIRYYE